MIIALLIGCFQTLTFKLFRTIKLNTLPSYNLTYQDYYHLGGYYEKLLQFYFYRSSFAFLYQLLIAANSGVGDPSTSSGQSFVDTKKKMLVK